MEIFSIDNQIVKNVQNKRKKRTSIVKEGIKKPFLSCLVMEMEEDYFLRDFFAELERHVQRIRRARGIDYERKARELDEIVRKFDKQRRLLIEKLETKGIQIDENVLGSGYSLAEFELGSGNISWQKFDYAHSFNGLELTMDMLSNPNDTTYKDRLEKQKAKTEGYEERRIEINKKLRSNKILYFTSRKEYEALRKELSDIEFDLSRISIYERDLHIFESLTLEQKELILQYLEIIDAMSIGIEAINDLLKQFQDNIPPKTDLSVMSEAIDRMAANGMNENDLLKVFERLDGVETKRLKGEYDNRRVVSINKMDVPSTFIENVYDVERPKEVSERNE